MNPSPAWSAGDAPGALPLRRAVLWIVDNGSSHRGEAAAATSLYHLGEDILAFETGYQEVARPFEWKVTQADPDQLLDRLSALPEGG